MTDELKNAVERLREWSAQPKFGRDPRIDTGLLLADWERLGEALSNTRTTCAYCEGEGNTLSRLTDGRFTK